MTTDTAIRVSDFDGVAQVTEFHKSVLEGISGGTPVVLDFSDVDDIDASVLQVVMAAKASASDKNTTLHLENVSDELLRRSAMTGSVNLYGHDDCAEIVS